MSLSDNWRSHEWSSGQGGEAIKVDEMTRIRYVCKKCERAFVEDPVRIQKWAVNQHETQQVAGYDPYNPALEDEVTKKWLAELCPGKPLSSDEVDRKRMKNKT